MSLEFRKIESYKSAEIELGKIKSKFLNEKAFTDDFWIYKIYEFLISFYNNYPCKNLTQKSEKEITRIIRNWLKNNEDFIYSSLIVESEPETEGTEQIGYNDLKFTHSFWTKYFVIECKLLNESKTLIKEYIYNPTKKDGGLYRFLTNKYASFLDFGGMLGYIKDGDISRIIRNIKHELSILQIESLTGIKFGEVIQKELLNRKILDQDYSFQSNHSRLNLVTDKKISPIQMFHLFFNFSSDTNN